MERKKLVSKARLIFFDFLLLSSKDTILGKYWKIESTTAFLRKLNLFIFFSFLGLTLFSQTYNIKDNKGQTISTCSGTFYDSGGPGEIYGNDENYTVTFCSQSGKNLKFDFSNVFIRSGDVLNVYDGTDTSFPLIGSYSGDSDSGGIPDFSTISSGTCLTFNFQSDALFGRDGWSANISCFTCSQPVTSPILPSDSPVCAGTTITYSVDNHLGSTYNWTVTKGTPASVIGGTNSLVITWDFFGGNTGIIRVDEVNVCGQSDFSTRHIDIYPQVIVDFSGLNSVYCLEDASVTLTGNPPGGVFNGPGISGNTFTPLSAGIGTHNIGYTYTDPLSNCTNQKVIQTTVNENTVTLTSAAGTDNQTVCINTPITNITYGTTIATGATFTGLPAGVTGIWGGNVVTISGSPSVLAGSPYSYMVTLTGGCGIVTATGTITVTPNNTVNRTSAAGTDGQTVCNNTVITNITYATTEATGATFAGLPAGVTGAWVANVVTISGTPTVSGPFNYTVTLTGGCGNITANGTITVTPNNTISLTSAAGTNNQTVCINTAITNITYATTEATGATFAGLPAGVTGAWAANVVTISGTPTVSGPFNYTVTLTGGCGNVTANGTITVTLNNTIILTSVPGTDNQTVCIGKPITTITYSTTGASGANFIGLPAGMTVSWAANTVTISGSPTTSGIYNYIITLTGGCGNITANGTITVTPNNTISLTSAAGTNNQTVCINTAITNITYGTTGATGATFAGLPAGITGAWAANVVTISGTPTVSGPFNYTVTLTGGCGNVTANGTITVTLNNTLTLTSAAGTDNQTDCINTAITNITYGTTGATGATFTGLPAGVAGTWAANVVTISGTPTASGPFNYTVTLTGGCGNVTANGTIAVTPANTLTLTSAAGTNNQTVCINTAITNITYGTTGAMGATFTGLPAGVTGTWAANVVTISGTPTASGPFNYTVTLTGGCGNVTANGTITVTPANTLTLTSAAGTNNQIVCINTAITNITYGTTGATGATFTGLPAGVTGIWGGNVVTISGSPSVLAGSPYSYMVTLTGGCGIVTATGTITVTPNNTVNRTSAAGTDGQTVCNNTVITNITYATTEATGATFAGLPAGVTGTWAANVVTISGTPTASGPFNYTVTLTGGCGNVTANGTIAVTPDNTLTLTSAAGTDNQAVCINTAIIDITYSTTGATGATFAGLPAGVTGAWAANVVTISGTPTTLGPFNYTVTLTGGCGNVTANGTITVTLNNTLTLTSAAGTDNQTDCINTAITNITYGTTGATGATFTGLPAGVAGAWAANVVTISGTPTTSGPFNYTVTLTGGCGNVTANGTITVTPDNTITLTSGAATTNQTLCINTAITNITYGTTGAMGATFTGLPAGVTGTWAANVVTISGTPTASGPFNYTVTLTGGCGNVTANGTITVTIENTIILTSSAGTDNQTICLGNAITIITYTTTGATGAAFTGLPAGMMVGWAANTVTLSGTPTTSGIFSYTINLSGGCGIISSEGTITVNTDNTIMLTSAAGTDNQTLCINSTVINITYATTIATGASFSGLPAGVTGSWSADVVTISGTPTASGPFNYTVTLTGGCGNMTANGAITVTPDNTLTLTSAAGTDNQTVCINTVMANISYSTTDATGATVTGLPAGVTGSWASDIVTITGTPSVSGSFSYIITLTGGCGVITTGGTITVIQDNTMTLSSATGTDNQTLCLNTAVTNITYSTTVATGATFTGLPAGVTGAWAANVVTISGTPTVSGPFNYTITLTGGCGNVTASGTLTVNDLPSGTTISTDVLCYGASTGTIDLTPAGGASPYTFLWNTGAVNEDLNNVPAGSYTVIITDANLCTGTVSGTVSEPAAALVGTTSVTNVLCSGGATGSIDLTVTGGTAPYTFLWSNGATTEDLTNVVAGNYTVTITDANNCTASSAGDIIALSGSTVVSNVSCFGGSDGSVNLTVVGGTAPYTFLWSNSATTEDLANVSPGIYTVTITDANSCPSNSGGTVTEPVAALSRTTVVTNVLCFGGATGSIDLTVTGGTAPYSFLWSNGATTKDLTNVVAGNYTVTITDANGCTNTINSTITQPLTALAGSITTQTNVSCSGLINGSVTISGAGGTSPYEYSLNGGTYQVFGIFNSLTAATYIITVRDANLCTADISVTITEPEAISITESKVDASCPGVADGNITLTITGGTQPYSVLWSDGILTADRLNIPDGTYRVVVTDLNECPARLDVVVDVIGSELCLEIPDIITPNNDGYNDTWVIKNIDMFPNAEVFVFTRWGKLVFNSKNLAANPWNGTFKGKLLPTDSYHYVLHLNDGSKPRSGVISIIR